MDDMIIQYLYQEEIFTESHLEEIESEPSNRKKTLKLLDILPTRGSRAFYHFTQSLEKDFPWIKDKLLRLCAEDTESESPPPPFTGESCLCCVYECIVGSLVLALYRLS